MAYIASMLHTCRCADLVTSYNSHGLKFPSLFNKELESTRLHIPNKEENCCWLSDFVFFWIISMLERICSQDFKTLVTTSAFLAATLIMVTLIVPCRAVYMWGITCLVCHSHDICDHFTSLSLFPLFSLFFSSGCEPLNGLSEINLHLRKLGMKWSAWNLSLICTFAYI
jgi:hypothetical protein